MSADYIDIEDFILDPQFKSWVLSPQPETNEFWSKWLENHPEQKKKFLLAKELIQNTEFRQVVVPDEASERVLNSILKKTSINLIEPTRSNGRDVSWRMTAKMAASVFLVLGVYFVIRYYEPDKDSSLAEVSYTIKENPAGRKSQVFLPDGSIVWLNSASSLKYINDFKGDKRVVKLSGEAYFDVAKDEVKPFIVEFNNMSVRALGTEFNVKAFEGDRNTEIVLIEGNVQVESHGDGEKNQTAFLEPGEYLRYDNANNKALKEKADIETLLFWKNGVIHFDRASFEEVILKLERWYGVEIMVENNAQKGEWEYSSEFNNQSLEVVLKSIGYTKKFDYHIDKDTVTLKF